MTAIATVLLAMIGVAALATLLSGQAKTPAVLGQLGQSLSYLICVATSPVTGQSCGGASLNPVVTSTVTFPPM